MKRLSFVVFLLSIVLTLFCLNIAMGLRNQGETNFRNHAESKWKPEDEYNRHDRATVKIRRRKEHSRRAKIAKDSDENITAEITAFNKTFTLELSLNRYLISASYVEHTVDLAGHSEIHGHANTIRQDCYYIGRVSNETGAAAALDTCDGTRAQFVHGNELYQIEPLNNVTDDQFLAYRQSDSKRPTYACGLSAHLPSTMKAKEIHSQRKKRASLNWPQDLDGTTRVVELYVVNDYTQYVAFNGNLSSTVTRTKRIVNFASSLYQPLNIYISLVGVETWTGGSLIRVNSLSSDETHDNFNAYRIANITPKYKNDNAQLITPITYANYVVGLAFFNGMCSLQLSSAIISDTSSLPGDAGSTMAHEMGHNFGMDHDDELPGPCSCGDTACIMNSVGTDPQPTLWSDCSKQSMTLFFASQRSNCLNDFNGIIYDSTSNCGNGIVEAAEQCDCGAAPVTECNATCCNATTCQLIPPATCAAGRCCDLNTCQLKPITSVCRTATGVCDVAEYCSGTNNTCPSNAYVHDGTNCTVDGVSAYCFGGLCRSHQSQCKSWWGSNVNNSVSACYTKLNKLGLRYGNCGTSAAGSFIGCSDSDVLCGLLHCDYPFVSSMENPPVKMQCNYELYVNYSGNPRIYCTAGSCNLDEDPGMVPNGASCDSTSVKQMCVNQKCTAVSNVINSTSCPSCNQHGVCNNLGQCHCDIGYGPPDCSLPGNGGSYHSNPIQILQTTGAATSPALAATSTVAIATTITNSSQSTEQSTPATQGSPSSALSVATAQIIATSLPPSVGTSPTFMLSSSRAASIAGTSAQALTTAPQTSQLISSVGTVTSGVSSAKASVAQTSVGQSAPASPSSSAPIPTTVSSSNSSSQLSTHTMLDVSQSTTTLVSFNTFGAFPQSTTITTSNTGSTLSMTVIRVVAGLAVAVGFIIVEG